MIKLWSVLLMIASFVVAIHLCALFDFGYPLLFEWLNIYDFIQTYGPQNRFKIGFESLDPAVYIQLFHDTSYAIMYNPASLKDISYFHEASGSNIQLYRQAEVIHLQDVARLISRLNSIGLICIIGCCIIPTIYRYKKIQLAPTFIKDALVPIGIIILTTCLIFATAPLKFFYWGHKIIFRENQWFFYYQESLMTTLMKAPTLFGPLGIFILIVAIFIFVSLFILFQKINKHI